MSGAVIPHDGHGAFGLEGPGLSNKVTRFFTKRYVLALNVLLKRDMHVITDAQKKIAYLPIPKAACSSVKHALLENHNPILAESYRHDELRRVHQFFSRQPGMWMSEHALRSFGGFRFSVIRDPIDRFMSAYQNRVMEFRDLGDPDMTRANRKRSDLSSFPDINEFALRLLDYCRINSSIHHHLRPQAEFIRDRNLFDAIRPLDQLAALMDDIEQATGVRLDPPRANASKAEKPALKIEAITALKAFYRADYEMFPDLLTPPKT